MPSNYSFNQIQAEWAALLLQPFTMPATHSLLTIPISRSASFQQYLNRLKHLTDYFSPLMEMELSLDELLILHRSYNDAELQLDNCRRPLFESSEHAINEIKAILNEHQTELITRIVEQTEQSIESLDKNGINLETTLANLQHDKLVIDNGILQARISDLQHKLYVRHLPAELYSELQTIIQSFQEGQSQDTQRFQHAMTKLTTKGSCFQAAVVELQKTSMPVIYQQLLLVLNRASFLKNSEQLCGNDFLLIDQLTEWLRVISQTSNLSFNLPKEISTFLKNDIAHFALFCQNLTTNELKEHLKLINQSLVGFNKLIQWLPDEEQSKAQGQLMKIDSLHNDIENVNVEKINDVLTLSSNKATLFNKSSISNPELNTKKSALHL